MSESENRVPQNHREFNTWWRLDGAAITRGIIKKDFGDSIVDVEDIIQRVSLKLYRQYCGSGKTLVDVQRMQPQVVKNACIDQTRLIRPVQMDAENADRQVDESLAANPDRKVVDADVHRQAMRILDRGVALGKISPHEVAIWIDRRLKDNSARDVRDRHGIRRDADVADAVNAVSKYLWTRQTAESAEPFTPHVVSKQPRLISEVAAAVEKARLLARPRPPVQAATLAEYIALQLRAAGRLVVFKGDPKGEITAMLCDMCVDTGWCAARFARSSVPAHEVQAAVSLGARAMQYFRDKRYKEAHQALAEAVTLCKGILQRLIGDTAPRNGDDGHE